MNSLIKATFATNRSDSSETVADAISGHLDWLGDTWKKPFTLAIATAYINPAGFALIEHAVTKAQTVRLLIGAEPDAPLARIRSLTDGEDPEVEALEGHDRTLEEDRDLLGFTEIANASARKFIDWLQSGVVEVRRFESGFLHGKAYLVDTDDEGVIAGSSNLTYAGLATNHELNLGHYQPETVQLVREWFNQMWEASKPYDLAAVYEARFLPHSPYLIYLRMLWEKYGAEVEALAREDAFGLHLAPFQRDGVTLARMILGRYNGVIVADGVGLGKTFVAGELIREAVEDRRQRVVVVAPATLRDGPWSAFLAQHFFNFEIVSFDELSMDQQLNPAHPNAKPVLRHSVNEYAMVVIDEAHAYRSTKTQRADVLNRLLEGSPPKAVVMLTATPVNNSLWDLYNLLAYFVRNDAEFASAGIPSLREKFKQASITDPDALDPEQLFDVLSPVVVRRTRSYVKHYYPDTELEIRGVRQRVSFPRPEVRAVNYNLGTVLPGFLDRFAAAVDVPDDDTGGARIVLSASEFRAAGHEVLTLARYAPSAYLLGGAGFEAYEGQVAGLLRSGLLKRFESSAHAFANTCETMAESHDQFIQLLDRGVVATGAALEELSATDSDDFSDVLAARGAEWNWSPATAYDAVRLRADVEADRDLLLAWAAEARTISPEEDPKLQALADELAVILAESEGELEIGESSTERDRRKVIIFSYYADTVSWIEGWLQQAILSDSRLAPYLNRVVTVSGSDRETDQQKALFGFAPITAEAPPGQADEFDVLITTDVLAEGVNLQQARHIINYDLPWNPMRLVQRHGRIDRIGSPHTRVWLRCFMPDRNLDDLLGLEQRLHRKIKQAARSIGVESFVIPGSEVSDRYFSDTREAIEEIRQGQVQFLNETRAGMSVEEYRQQLREGLENPFLAEQIRRLAWGSGSGKAVIGAEPGFVFCARVGDNPEPQFRYVNMLDPDNPRVVTDLLACLKHAESSAQTERSLTEEAHSMAYRAWAGARESIYEGWMWATDPRNLQPEVPKIMRDAAEFIRTNPPPDMEQAAVDRVYDILNAPYAERVRRQVRAVLNDSDISVKAAGLIDIVERLGLTPPPVPKPLPLIDDMDINLVCWMAIIPSTEEPETIVEQLGELPLGDRL